MRSRVLFVNRYFFPDQSATSQILSGIAFDLAEQGHDVHVITGRQLYEDATASLAGREIINGVSVHRLRTTRFGRRSLLGRLADYVTFYVAVAVHLAWTLGKADIVIAKTDPPMLSLITTPIAKLRGAKCVSWLQDLFPEVAPAVGVGGLAGRVVSDCLRPLRNWSLARADRTVAIGDRMREHLVAQGIAPSSISVIANWSDAAIVHPIPHRQNALRHAWNLDDRIVIGYSGNFGRVHDFATVVDAIELVHASRATEPIARNMTFVFSGNGPQREALEREIVRRGVDGMVQLRPYQPQARLAESLSCADIHLVTLRPELEGLVVPSKIYGIMASGRPAIFVGAKDGEIAHLLQRERCGSTIAAGDGHGLAQCLLALAKDPATRDAMGMRARAAFEANFTRQHASMHWRDLLETLGLSSTPGKLPMPFGDHEASAPASNPA